MNNIRKGQKKEHNQWEEAQTGLVVPSLIIFKKY